MKNEGKEKKGSSAFFWGLIIGALIATLLTTKRGRRVLRELSELSLELIENFIEERVADGKEGRVGRTDEKAEAEKVGHATEDKESKMSVRASDEISEEFQRYDDSVEAREEKTTSSDDEAVAHETNGHKKKRLFRGIRRTK